VSKQIFISYRRDDSFGQATAICTELQKHMTQAIRMCDQGHAVAIQ
jgi:hypothetical protein